MQLDVKLQRLVADQDSCISVAKAFNSAITSIAEQVHRVAENNQETEDVSHLVPDEVLHEWLTEFVILKANGMVHRNDETKPAKNVPTTAPAIAEQLNGIFETIGSSATVKAEYQQFVTKRAEQLATEREQKFAGQAVFIPVLSALGSNLKSHSKDVGEAVNNYTSAGETAAYWIGAVCPIVVAALVAVATYKSIKNILRMGDGIQKDIALGAEGSSFAFKGASAVATTIQLLGVSVAPFAAPALLVAAFAIKAASELAMASILSKQIEHDTPLLSRGLMSLETCQLPNSDKSNSIIEKYMTELSGLTLHEVSLALTTSTAELSDKQRDIVYKVSVLDTKQRNVIAENLINAAKVDVQLHRLKSLSFATFTVVAVAATASFILGTPAVALGLVAAAAVGLFAIFKKKRKKKEALKEKQQEAMAGVKSMIDSHSKPVTTDAPQLNDREVHELVDKWHRVEAKASLGTASTVATAATKLMRPVNAKRDLKKKHRGQNGDDGVEMTDMANVTPQKPKFT